MAIWRLTASGSIYGMEKWANVFHCDIAGAPNEVGIFTALGAFYTGSPNGVLLHCPGDVASGTVGVKLTQFSLQAVDSPAPPIVTLRNDQGGQNTAGGLPVDVSMVISWRTNLAGRSYRGRTYCPPFHENKNDDGPGLMPSPSVSTINSVKNACSKLLTDMGTAGAPLVVYSRKLRAGRPIIGGYIDNAWDTQRRRSNAQPTTRTTFP